MPVSKSLAIAALVASGAWQAEARPPRPCPRCGWGPPPAAASAIVGTTGELEAALALAGPGASILLRDGVYRLERSIDIAVPGVTLRGQSGDRDRVVLRGAGLDERQVGTALSVSAPGVTLADLSVGLVAHHGVQVRGERGADGVTIHNIRVVDSGQQLIKGSMGEDGRGPHRGLLSCSTLEYSDQAPSPYTNGVDVLGGLGWTVRHNVFRHIRGPADEDRRAGPAILFWGGSRETLVEGNLVLDCFRGIALGLRRHPGADGPGADHRGGVIRHNLICNRGPWADEAIEANACPGVLIERNTVLVEGRVPWSIGIRFPEASALVRHNLTNRPIVLRDEARAEQESNITDAQPRWFVDPSRGDLRPAPGHFPPIDAGAFAPEPRTPARPGDVGPDVAPGRGARP